MTRSDTLAIAKAKLGARDRRNRAIIKQLAVGESTRVVGAAFGLTPKRIRQICVQEPNGLQRLMIKTAPISSHAVLILARNAMAATRGSMGWTSGYGRALW
jgi:hypothetical protein